MLCAPPVLMTPNTVAATEASGRPDTPRVQMAIARIAIDSNTTSVATPIPCRPFGS
jgi:hypothetical protein